MVVMRIDTNAQVFLGTNVPPPIDTDDRTQPAASAGPMRLVAFGKAGRRGLCRGTRERERRWSGTGPIRFPALRACTPIAVAAVTLALAGCASTGALKNDTVLDRVRIPRPERIIVQDFAGSPSDVDPATWTGELVFSQAYAPTSRDVALGRELGRLVADRLVDRIREMGLGAVNAQEASPARLGDVVIVGHFESFDEGSATRRVLVGFGSGKSEVVTVVQGFLMTEDGLQRLGGSTVESKGGGGPGLLVPLAVTAATSNPLGLVVGGAAKTAGEVSGSSRLEGAARRTADFIADRLERRFRQQGWI